ncbi:MAG: flavodoxin family protein [Desulfobacterales bacterium]|nr:flavodoxin family protein [Desulfobacterales bacterium]MDX2509916.1 flavodoxin family protein [Desulfobacterales bacterium]
MKVLIAYLSESGNTGKLANAIFEGIESSEKEILSIKDVAGIEGYDVIFIGFPVQSHSVPAKVEAFAKTLPDGQKVAYFATHGSMRGGEMAVTAFYHALTISKNAVILGTFGSRGEVKQSIIDSLLQKPEHRGWALEAQGAAGHPDAADLEDGKDWARNMFAKARAS